MLCSQSTFIEPWHEFRKCLDFTGATDTAHLFYKKFHFSVVWFWGKKILAAALDLLLCLVRVLRDSLLHHFKTYQPIFSLWIQRLSSSLWQHFMCCQRHLLLVDHARKTQPTRESYCSKHSSSCWALFENDTSDHVIFSLHSRPLPAQLVFITLVTTL